MTVGVSVCVIGFESDGGMNDASIPKSKKRAAALIMSTLAKVRKDRLFACVVEAFIVVSLSFLFILLHISLYFCLYVRTCQSIERTWPYFPAQFFSIVQV